jgi:formylglycine-generating enzyme required for sulfatase activity
LILKFVSIKVSMKTLLHFSLGLGIAFLAFFSSRVFANAVVISNTALVNQNTTNKTWQVRFNLTWNNSWKDNINFDAVWIFCKYRVQSGPWLHATLNTSGFNGGTGTPNNINVACDRVGAFVSRRDQGQGTFTANNMELQWNYGANGVNDTNTISLNIYAIEMVYVPSGPFTIGDGNGVNSSSSGSFYAVSEHLPYTIDNLMSPDIGAQANTNFTNASSNPTNRIRIDGDGGLDLNSDGIVDSARFPTGFNAFYIMKYPVTQGQYVDFLNVLDYAQQSVMVNNATNVQGQNAFNAAVGAVNRYTILVQTAGTSPSVPRVYSTARPDRVNNYMGSRHVLAYLDWSGLRPFTELEFEKACRGPLPPVLQENAAGTADCCTNSSITLSGTENGTESWVNPNTNWGKLSFGTGLTVAQGDAGTGPVRAGLAAATNTFSAYPFNRRASNKTYWGIDNMDDITRAPMVCIDNVAGRSFTGIHGDGLLTSTGYANQANWPCANGNTNQTIANVAANSTGCTCTTTAAGLYMGRSGWRISERSLGSLSSSNAESGCRGARTAFTSEFGFSTTSTNITINNPVNFEASAFNGATYSWSFPSGSPSSSSTNPTNTTWSTVGTYNVSLQAIAGQCTSNTAMPLIVYTACVPPTSINWSGTTSSFSNNTWGNGQSSVDGNLTTNVINSIYTSQSWSFGTLSTSNFAWTVYDLGSSQTVSTFKMTSFNECYTCCGGAVGAFELQSGNSVTGPWTTVFSGTGISTQGWQSFSFTPTNSRYWRIKINGNTTNPWNSTSCVYLHEVGFEGCN